MKKIFKALSSIAAAVLLVSACNVEHPMPTYSPVNSSEVSFVQSTITNTEILGTATTFDVTLSRNTSSEAATVAVKSTFTSGVVCPASVTFNAGESTATLTLDVSGMQVGTKYTGTISLADSASFNANIAVATTKVTLQKVYTWVSLGEGEFIDPLSFGAHPQKVEVLKADGFSLYRVMNPYPKDAVIADWGSDWYGGPVSPYIQFSINEDGTVKWSGKLANGVIYIGISDDAYLWGYYPSEFNPSYAALDAQCKTLEDGKIIQMVMFWRLGDTGYALTDPFAAYLNMPNSGIDLLTWYNQ